MGCRVAPDGIISIELISPRSRSIIIIRQSAGRNYLPPEEGLAVPAGIINGRVEARTIISFFLRAVQRLHPPSSLFRVPRGGAVTSSSSSPTAAHTGNSRHYLCPVGRTEDPVASRFMQCAARRSRTPQCPSRGPRGGGGYHHLHSVDRAEAPNEILFCGPTGGASCHHLHPVGSAQAPDAILFFGPCGGPGQDHISFVSCATVGPAAALN